MSGLRIQELHLCALPGKAWMQRPLLVREAVPVPRTLSKKPCKDCGSVTRKVTAPGPRCATCHRERKKATRRLAHGRWIKATYGLTIEQYEALYEAQGGVCYICERATGARKKLAVDHDHKTGYVRGLLCGPCNNILAHLRDDPFAAYRAADYLAGDTPAKYAIGRVKPDGEDRD